MPTTIGKIAILVIALALLTAACGDDAIPFGATPPTTASGSSGSGDDTTTADTHTTTADTDATTADTDTTGPVTTTDAPSGDGDIDDLLARAESAPLRTTYRFGEAPDDQIVTLVQDPTREPPASAMILEEGKFISLGDRTIVCGMGGVAQCFEIPGAEGANLMQGLVSPMLMSLLLTESAVGTSGFSMEEGRTEIAGRQGVCFTFTPQAFAGSGITWIRQCIDSELGFTLLFEGKDTADDAPERIMELLEFGQPQPGDFEPTSPVMEMPGG